MLSISGSAGRRLALLLALAGSAPSAALAQNAELAAAPLEAHLLEIRDGALHLDGRRLPDAAPEGVDLSGLAMAMEFAGPVTPVVEIELRNSIVWFTSTTKRPRSLSTKSTATTPPPTASAARSEMSSKES